MQLEAESSKVDIMYSAKTDQAANCIGKMQSANTEQDGGEKCQVRTPYNANNNGPKWQRMKIYYDYVLCAVSVLLACVPSQLLQVV